MQIKRTIPIQLVRIAGMQASATYILECFDAQKMLYDNGLWQGCVAKLSDLRRAVRAVVFRLPYAMLKLVMSQNLKDLIITLLASSIYKRLLFRNQTVPIP